VTRVPGRSGSRRPRAPFRRSLKFFSTVAAHAALSSLQGRLLIAKNTGFVGVF
jgi:hypothetical protein